MEATQDLPDQSGFHYDYETLRTTGVILAVVMFVSGILIALTPAQVLAPRYQRQKCLPRPCRESAVEGRRIVCRQKHTSRHTHTHVHAHMYTHTCTPTHVHPHMYTHTCTPTHHVHVHIHTQFQTLSKETGYFSTQGNILLMYLFPTVEL